MCLQSLGCSQVKVPMLCFGTMGGRTLSLSSLRDAFTPCLVWSCMTSKYSLHSESLSAKTTHRVFVLNMITPQLPYGSFLSLGAGWVYKINDHIVLKFPRKAGCERFAHEIKIYDVLESHHSPCPDIIYSFLRESNANFLTFCAGGTLDKRLRSYQIRNQEPHGGRLLQITNKEPLNLVERWIMELSNAAAWLESIGFVHTDQIFCLTAVIISN